MSYAETPAMTDAEFLKKEIVRLNDLIEDRKDREQALVDAVNNMGKNLQWIVENVQGIFQMFSDPGVINNMMTSMMGGNMMMGGITDGGTSEDGPTG